jgi:hypothetical protein
MIARFTVLSSRQIMMEMAVREWLMYNCVNSTREYQQSWCHRVL